MKLSVKWLAGLAVLALAIVAVVGASSTTKAAVGVIYVANTGQATTTEPGRNLTDHGEVTVSSVWATYAADIAGGQPLRLIDSDTDAQAGTAGDATDADLVRVVIVDEGYDIATTQDDAPTTALDLSAPFVTTALDIPGAVTFPVSGDIADIEIYLDDGGTPGAIDGTNTQIAGPGASPVQATVLAVNAAGDSIQVRSEISGGGTPDVLVRYQSSLVDTIEFGEDPDPLDSVTPPLPEDPLVIARSDVNTAGQGLFLTETGRSTGRFVGFVRLTDANGATDDGLAHGPATGSTAATAAVLRVAGGPVVIQYLDSDGTTRTANVLIDTSAPTPTVTGPADNLATQNRQPTFSGTVSEAGSGLDISAVNLVIHEAVEAAVNSNAIPVIDNDGANNGVEQAISRTGAADGDFSFSFTFTPQIALPTGVVGQPNHIVDFQIRAEDLAGNLGFSDADNDPSEDGGTENQGVTITSGVVPPALPHDVNGSFDAHRVKIDLVAPAILSSVSTPAVSPGDHKTGLTLDALGDEVADSKSLRVKFNDDVQNVVASDLTVEFPSVSAIIAPVSVQVDGPNVYVTLTQDIPADERPIVRIQGSIEDTAGNGTAFGSASVSDGIAPTLTATLSGGSGTGTGAAGPSELTKDEMLITITSNEALAAPPFVEVFDVDGGPAEDSGTALSFGTNTWTFTFNDTPAIASGDKAVVVTGEDRATAPVPGTLASDDNNEGTYGASDEKSFRLDDVFSPAEISPDGSTSQVRPFIIVDFPMEASTVTINEILLDDVDVTSELVASSDEKKFFIAPSSDLSLGEHTVEIPATMAVDAAGNTSPAITTTFMVEERGVFVIDVFAGWNALSFPSDPVDPDINSVFTNPGHDAVLGFDFTVNGQWVVAVRDVVSGLLEPATENGLTSVRSTQAYWVHSNNFEEVEALLTGETLPGDGSPPGIITIPTTSGFNAVPIVDTSRKQTTGPQADLVRQLAGGGDDPVTVANYLGSVSEGRVYQYNPETLTFELMEGADVVQTGDVLFVEVTGTPVPIFP